jgi:hypothetical protein
MISKESASRLVLSLINQGAYFLVTPVSKGFEVNIRSHPDIRRLVEVCRSDELNLKIKYGAGSGWEFSE